MNPQQDNLSADDLQRALSVRDLTDPAQGPHAMQVLVQALHESLARRWGCRRQLHRPNPVVVAAEDSDPTYCPPDGNAATGGQPRWITPQMRLRTQTSTAMPGLLQALAIDPPDDLLLVCPGLVYRHNPVDRLHCAEPHQLDLWRIARIGLGPVALGNMVSAVMADAAPGADYRLLPSSRPHTRNGMQIDLRMEGQWVEIGQCGLAAPELLTRSGLDPDAVSGLAMGLDLDRLLMARKGIPDIRLLRSEDPEIAAQMLDLAPYRPVSAQPWIGSQYPRHVG